MAPTHIYNVCYITCRSKNRNENAYGNEDAHSNGALHRHESYPVGMMNNMFENGHHEPEPHYESLEHSHKDRAQPTEYEEFQPSSVTTTTSQLPLLNQEPEPYEAVRGYTQEDGQTNEVYETVRDPGKLMAQRQYNNHHNGSPSDHIYFTLEPNV